MTRILAKKTGGITLIELLVAIGIFAIASTVATSLIIDIVKMERRNSVENQIYDDARIILQQITNEINSGTIDYEEYYNTNVLQTGDQIFMGKNYGAYGSRFFDPGEKLGNNPVKNPTDLGKECTKEVGANCEAIYIPSADLNVGQNPWTGQGKANAFCDINENCDDKPQMVDELFLIDKTGTKKTILARKLLKVNDYALGLIRLKGIDNDQNGFIDQFECEKAFVCDEQEKLPVKGDLSVSMGPDSQFIPISPLRSNIKSLKFLISPVEDPYKAFVEKNMQIHPSVTILMTIGLTSEAQANYPGEFVDLTIQTTVSAGVQGRIDSYPATEDVQWIKDVIPQDLVVAE